jgi:hypothetical protein
VAWKPEILQEISAMVEDNKRKEKMYYHLQYGLLDIKDDHIPNDGIGAFLMDLNEGKQYTSITRAHSITKDFIKLLKF